MTTDVPALDTEAKPNLDTAAPAVEDAVSQFQPGDDGATTPGGPTMIWILTGIFVLISWLRRRHRKRRQKG